MDANELGQRLSPYVGGQLEIKSLMEDYLYRGEIASVEVNLGNGIQDPGEVKVQFKWLAKRTGQATWENETNLDYGISLLLARFSLSHSNRIIYRVSIVWEEGVFIPPGDDQLDPSVVQGLTLA